MTLLLDTHAVLWYWWDDPRLSATAKGLIDDPANVSVISPATPWEVAIKVSGGKLSIPGGYGGYFPREMRRTRFQLLATTDDHLTVVAALPRHHRATRSTG
ncbi:MAG: type II toxin-antitoxin system VapC family toxin [Gemmataceae bacterium]|nr:type II toxin-antitoxin system VapC family toxin [Gemmataceae bacterium]